MYYVKFGDDILYSEQVYLNWIFRIVLATLCGCAIGYERTSRNKSAGIRTHAIIALGSSMFMIFLNMRFLMCRRRMELEWQHKLLVELDFLVLA